MQPDPHKTRSTLQRLQKRCLSVEKGGRWDLRPDAFSSGAEMLIPEARARSYVSICVGRGESHHRPYLYMSGLHLDPDVSSCVRRVSAG